MLLTPFFDLLCPFEVIKNIILYEYGKRPELRKLTGQKKVYRPEEPQ